MNKPMYTLSRIYGRWGAKAQRYAMVNPKGLPGKLRFQWHAYRATLFLIILFALMLFMQDMVIFWSAFGLAIFALYMKGILEEKLDAGIAKLMHEDSKVTEEETEDDREQHPV